MKLLKWLFISLIFLADILSVYSVYFSLNGPWWISWITPFLPFYLISLILLVVISLLLKNLKLILLNALSALLLLILTSSMWISVFNTPSQIDMHEQLSVMNYNVSFFYTLADYSEDYDDPIQNPKGIELISWLEQQSVDIIGLQEFWNDSVSHIFNVISKMENEGYKYHYFINNPRIKKPRRRGLIIFSRWEILDRGEIYLSENRFNGAQYVDVLWKNDTVRVINIHLESAQLGYLPSSARSWGWLKKVNWKLNYLKNITLDRKKQTRLIGDYALESPYPVIIIGDFNSQAYSGLVKQFEAKYNSAHLKGGTGMLFTYFGDNLWPVGIDHQFYSDKLSIIRLIILKDTKYSAHRPVIGFYSTLRP